MYPYRQARGSRLTVPLHVVSSVYSPKRLSELRQRRLIISEPEPREEDERKLYTAPIECGILGTYLP